jgi:hypothetical protein
MDTLFAAAGGTVIGREHRLSGLPNQDAYAVQLSSDLITAIVCDGCGSSPQSQIGAQLAARMTLSTIAEQWQQYSTQSIWRRMIQPAFPDLVALQRELLRKSAVIVDQLGSDRLTIVHDSYLFTLIGVVMTPAVTTVFSLGDGLAAINGRIHTLGPFEHNRPPYLGYGLLEPDQVDLSPSLLSLRTVERLATDDVHSLLLGTDGVIDLDAVAEQLVPGTTTPVGPLRQFWSNPWFVENPDGLRRKLNLFNRDIATPNWRTSEMQLAPGLLPDDTTIVIIRRREDIDGHSANRT